MAVPVNAEEEIGDSALQLIQITQETGSPSALEFANFKFDVLGSGEGKIFTLQHISARANVPVGQSVRGEVMCHGESGRIAIHRLVMTSQGIFDGKEEFVGSQEVTCYHIVTGPSLRVTISRNQADGTASFEASISGYLTDKVSYDDVD
jgi:hypothetical protein